ncbi:MAG: tetratricopeptide repeat protein [Pyrinomonadaceae bacterium]
MNTRFFFLRSFTALVLTTAVLFGTLPVGAQGDFVTSTDISGGSSVFVFRSSKKAKKSNFVARRKSAAKRTTKQRTTARKKVVSESKVVAKKNRVRRTIKKITPQEFQQLDLNVIRKSPQEASKVLAGAAEYYIEKDSDYEKAAAYLEEAITLDPNNKDAKLALSEISVTIGNLALDDTSLSRELRYSKALSYFEQAKENDSMNALALVGLAQVYEAQDEIDKARENYEKALELDSNMPEVKAALAYIYFADNRIGDSDRLLEEAIAGGEDNAEIQYFLGMVRYRQGRDKEAEKALRGSIALDDQNAEAHYYLGAVLVRIGEPEKAIESYTRATTLDPKFVNAWADLGVALYNAERYSEAATAFEKAVNENTNQTDELKGIFAESYGNWAETFRQLGDFDKAIAKYRVAVSLNPNDQEMITNFGFTLGAKKLWKDAIRNFEKAVELDPDAFNYANLGWAYLNSANFNAEFNNAALEKADLEKSREALKAAVEKDPNLTAALVNLGSVLNRLNQHSEAVPVLEEAVRHNKRWLAASYELGIAYLESGNYDKAVDQFKAAIKIDKEFGFAYLGLGKAEFKRGKTKNAEKVMDDLRKLNPKLADRLQAFFNSNR